MTIRINNISLSLNQDLKDLKQKVAKKLKIDQKYIKSLKILRESIDARKKRDIKFNYILRVSCENEKKIVTRLKDSNVKYEEIIENEKLTFGTKELKCRPIVVGMGPAGMFCALHLARNGYKPLVIERGSKVEERTIHVREFWKNGKLNLNSNVQFGEGGAGTFSDGKLTTRIKDIRCDFVLNEFVKYGAPEEILYMGKPHIGTDILKEVVKSIREEIINLGGEVRFDTILKDIYIKNGEINSIIVDGEIIECENLILALGHSARDTYEMLFSKGIHMSPKPFAMGVRIEHLQQMINENQYGEFANHPRLKAADYKLSYKSNLTNRSVYSFCMCPGGEVVAAASEEGRLVTNGMSNYSREKKNANSAIVVNVTEKDFNNNNPLAGIEFQRYYEELAFKCGGGDYKAPLQLVGDFLQDKISNKVGSVKPSYTPGYKFADLRQCLPSFVHNTLKDGLLNFDKKIKGFADDNAILTGIETRTSAPVRINRDERFQSISLQGLYPAGEGAGYAGGIMSASVDGIKVAEEIMKNYKPFN
ncbi:FAD-dependent oxidoreductase [Clostridium sediminicola]|uniref:NAD(P)/FAD-dependent oxidoreductase n=1 Tax=Clostridium sediminicola TaxID=3114879 RepID=UPI0031F243E2